MKIASWNVRGLGAEGKKIMIKSIIKEELLDLIGLVETKHNELSEWDMRKCWGTPWLSSYACHSNSRLRWTDTIMASRGLYINKFFCYDKVAMCGR